MGAPPPNPRDLPLLFSRMELFCFTRNGTCRIIEKLARRIGLRSDATRAPTQVRNGGRLHRRFLRQPAAPSKDCRFFVQPMGSTSEITLIGSPVVRRLRADSDFLHGFALSMDRSNTEE